jgi:hypothetical protein
VARGTVVGWAPPRTPILRGCGGEVLREGYSQALPGVKRNPARHASAWPWGHRDAVGERWSGRP